MMATNPSPQDAMVLFADGLALVYHEARHVRHLIRAGFIADDSWSAFTMLAANRVVAWQQLQAQRMVASIETTAALATAVFEARFDKDLAQLHELYSNPNWKHAKQVCGHAWLGITEAVSGLGSAVNSGVAHDIDLRSEDLLVARHNNGRIADKIVNLDRQIGVEPHQSWLDHCTGA
jgi:hypothetical protein